MHTYQIFSVEGNEIPFIPKKLFSEYPDIVSDLNIHSGWPCIKNTRIKATDIFMAQVLKGYGIEKMVLDFKSMSIKVTKKELEEACRFTIEWLHALNEKKTTKTSK
ncbi:MAG: hypothetical protein UT63_C0073G0014 [Candidatus Gottesmanbacteria bacterium GW2011_GWC2_39_8]|uniref:DUF433 domain-containing protein n=1 Tax=Candidatus Gottesmanbacteria bacterium GW2011_GWC2_39_8 TaxID=1618450 RepID=A0A0G0PTV8_9BACT|nr:MAG: hypothetical protein UT63_C0073G0014 [Candidatus Gottesmanbacteria bacterium GW2011_GWC2_39_8]